MLSNVIKTTLIATATATVGAAYTATRVAKVIAKTKEDIKNDINKREIFSNVVSRMKPHIVDDVIDADYHVIDSDTIDSDTLVYGDVTLFVTYKPSYIIPYLYPFLDGLKNTGYISFITKDKEVYVDDVFKSLSDNAKNTILAHEAGHLHHKHEATFIYNYERIVCICNNDILEVEKEADDYAVKMIGKYETYCGLLEISERLSGLPKQEVLMRAERISLM